MAVLAATAENLARAVETLRRGGLVVFPTETLYGIAAHIHSPEALERLGALKGRGEQKPFGLILSSADEVDLLVSEVPPLARRLMAQHWPGPLTLVLAAAPGLHPRLVSSNGGVGMRLSPHPVAATLARELGSAITATSANPAGADPPAQIDDLSPKIIRAVDIILDAGPCPGGPASTVLDARTSPPILLRPGAVPIPGARPPSDA